MTTSLSYLVILHASHSHLMPLWIVLVWRRRESARAKDISQPGSLQIHGPGGLASFALEALLDEQRFWAFPLEEEVDFWNTIKKNVNKHVQNCYHYYGYLQPFVSEPVLTLVLMG